MEPFCVAEINVRSSTNSPHPTNTMSSNCSSINPLQPGNISDCYEANPDIAGVGVRVSIYIQALLSFAPAILASVDGHVDSDEEELLYTIYVNLLLTACALLVSAFIQLATFGLGIYHALIVLNLSWIVNSSALLICVFPSLTRLDNGDTWWQWFQKIWPARRDQLLGLLLVTVHLCAMAVLGIQIWATPGEYGPRRRDTAQFSECLAKTAITLFGVDIPVTNSAIRGLSLSLYSITVVPLVNAIIFIILIGITSYYFQPFGRVFIKTWKYISDIPWTHNNDAAQRMERAEEAKHNPAYLSAMVLQFLVSAYLIINTELMISRSKDLVSTEDESNWTFGQTLSMLLIIFPFYKGVLKPTAGRFPTIEFHLAWFLRGLLREASKEWSGLYREADVKYAAVYQSLAALHEQTPSTSHLPTCDVTRKIDLSTREIIAAILVPLKAAKDLLDKSHQLMSENPQMQQSTPHSQHLHEEEKLRHFLVGVSEQISELREIIVTAYRARLHGVTQRTYFVNIGAILGASIANLDVAQLLLRAFISSVSSGLLIGNAT